MSIAIPTAVKKRFASSVPKLQKVLRKAREGDINESDTATIIKDMLSDIFGWDKYEDISSEYSIGGTRCDLAVMQHKKIEYLIEIKAVGIKLSNRHLRQAVNYAAREGIPWVVLTNGIAWQIFKVTTTGRIDHQVVFEFDFLELNKSKKEDQEKLFMLCKRGIKKDLLGEYHEYQKSVNPLTLSAVLQTEPVLKAIRREVMKLKSGLKVSNDHINQLLVDKVIKRDLIASEEAQETHKQVKKVLAKSARQKATGTTGKKRVPATPPSPPTGNPAAPGGYATGTPGYSPRYSPGDGESRGGS